MKKIKKMDRLTGQHIELVRKRCHKTRDDVAEHIGVSSGQIQKYERGTNRITVGSLYDIAEALGVSVYELLPSDKKTNKLGRIIYKGEA